MLLLDFCGGSKKQGNHGPWGTSVVGIIRTHYYASWTHQYPCMPIRNHGSN